MTEPFTITICTTYVHCPVCRVQIEVKMVGLVDSGGVQVEPVARHVCDVDGGVWTAR